MELVTILRLLWTRRLLVILGLGVALAFALLASRGALGPLAGDATQVSAVVSARVLVDTADSELVHVDPKASETLAMRAMLWAELLATEPARERIASAAGVPAGDLAVLGPSTWIEPSTLTPLVTRASAATLSADEPNVLRVYTSREMPVVALEATAPEQRQARRVVDGAVVALRSVVAAGSAAGEQPFVVEPFAEPRATELVSRSGRMLFVAVGVVAAFGLWCCAIVMIAGAARRLRGARATAA